jgi:PAS domain S-box-containing protein
LFVSVNQFLSLLSQLFFLVLGVVTVIDFIRNRDSVRRDIALMFGSIAIPVAASLFRRVTDIEGGLTAYAVLPLVAQPYLLVRLVQYLSPVPNVIRRLAFSGMVSSLLVVAIFMPDYPPAILLIVAGYFVAVDGYAMLAFIRGALVSTGVVRQRLRFAAFGSGLFALALGVIGLGALAPALREITSPATQLLAATSAVSFYIGFAPPRWLRSVWQFAELRAFLMEISHQPAGGHTTVTYFLSDLCLAANRAVGGSASIIVERGQRDSGWQVVSSGDHLPHGLSSINEESILNQVWQGKSPGFVSRSGDLSPADRDLLDTAQVETLLAVPILTQERVLGVLLVFIKYTSLFSEDDVELLRLLTQQGAVFLENIQLVEQLQRYSESLEHQVAERTRAFSESEERFRSIFEQAAVGIAEVSEEGRFIQINRRFCEIVGYSADELRRLTFQEITHPDDLETDLSGIDALRAGKIANYSIEKRYRHKVGHLVWVNLTSSLVREPGGESRHFLKIVEDISDHKHAEAARHEAESRFARVLDTTAEAVITIDSSQRIILFNQSAERIFGYTAAEMLGQPLDILLPADVVYRHHRFINEFADGPDIARGMGQRHGELRARRKDGVIFPIEASISKLTEGDQVILTVFIQDITQRKLAEKALQRLNEELELRVAERTQQLEAINRELEAFSYSVSHDLRAPLRALDGFSQALLEDYEDKLDEEGQEFLTLIRMESQRMGHLIDDLLDLSRLTRTDVSLVEVNLSAAAHEIAQKLREQDARREVEFVIEDDLWTCADSRLMYVALQNLLGNAWKYTGKQPKARIEFGCDIEDGQTVYFVRDNGVGFDMDYAHKLFGAFQRLHNVAEFEGTGIGLATVQRVIRQHGGSVRAQGVVDEGSVFFFTIGQGNCD